jgi:hypothetical protein
MDLNIIQIQEPRIFGGALIVPKVGGQRSRKPSEIVGQPPKRAGRIVTEKVKAVARKKLRQGFVEPDLPIFEELNEGVVIERVVCAPGVTLRNGSIMKSKPRQQKSGMITLAQYEDYRKKLEAEGSLGAG